MLGRFLERLRFPQLFLIFAGLAAADILIPDFVPFVDEIGLALLTALFAAWKRRRDVVVPSPGPSDGPPGAPPLPPARS